METEELVNMFSYKEILCIVHNSDYSLKWNGEQVYIQEAAQRLQTPNSYLLKKTF